MVAGHLRIQNVYYQMILSYKDINGKRKTKSISTELPEKGNKRKAAEMLLNMRRAYQPEETLQATNTPAELGNCSPLFCDFLQEWLEMIKNSVEITTYGNYQYSIKHCILPYFEPKGYHLNDIEKNPKYIQEYYQYELNVRKVSANTVIHRHANIRKCLQYAFQIGLIASNPADRIERPRKNIFVSDIYDEQELNELFQIFKGDPLEFAVITASYYGLRRSEVCGLKWKYIDFKENTITIKHIVTQTTVDGKYILVAKDKPKNKTSTRSLPLVPPFKEILLKLMEKQEFERKICGEAYCRKYSDYIYLNEIGELIKPGYITQHFSLVLNKNGLKTIRFHDLQHSCATLLFTPGVSPKEMQEWLGHSNISTTANIYTHMDFNKKISSANAIISLLDKEKEPPQL